jgi:hypothetical protein
MFLIVFNARKVKRFERLPEGHTHISIHSLCLRKISNVSQNLE